MSKFPIIEPTECHHDNSTLSSLRTLYASAPDIDVEMWFVECSVCHHVTAPFLTQQEAFKRALRGWWAR